MEYGKRLPANLDDEPFKTWKDCHAHDSFTTFSAGETCDVCGLLRYCGRCGWDSKREIREHDCDAMVKAINEPVSMFDEIDGVEVWRADTTLADLMSDNVDDEGLVAELMRFAEDRRLRECRIGCWTGGVVIVRRADGVSAADKAVR